MVYPTKRSEDRMGHKKVASSELPAIDKIVIEDEDMIVPEPDKRWSSIALYCWHAYLRSPVKKYFTETDYAFGWMACDAVDQAYKTGTATRINAAEQFMRSALFNESDRRRARVEITRKAEPKQETQADKNVSDFNARRAERMKG